MGTTDGLHTGLREAEVFDLAFCDQVLYRASNIFDRYIRVDAMLVEEIDGLNVEASERCLGDLFDAFLLAVQALPPRAAVGVQVEPKFRCDEDLVADRRKCLTNENLVGERSVRTFRCSFSTKGTKFESFLGNSIARLRIQ
jgi:hypothetical protein